MRFQVSILLLSVVYSCTAVAPTFKLPLIRSIVQKAGHLGQPVVNYYAPVSIGTPKKTFNIQFDVDFNELFVPHYEFFGSKLHHKKGFQCKESKSCTKTDRKVKIEYQQCELKGKPYQDLISFDTAQPYLRHSFEQKFLAISDASNSQFRHLEVDGFFGLSPSRQSTSGSGSESLLYSLRQAALIENMQFSFWFNPVHDANQGGELTFGGVDPNRYTGQIYWHQLEPSILEPMQDRWALNLQAVSLGAETITLGYNPFQYNYRAILSTGVSEIYGPANDVYRIYALLNVNMSGHSEFVPMIDCQRIHQLPILQFTIDGLSYPVLSTNYVRKIDVGRKSESCYIAILPSREYNRYQWVLGTNFLSAYYSIFDMVNRQVGFATLR